MDLKESLEKEEEKRSYIKTLTPLYQNIQYFDLFIKTLNYKERVNESYQKIEELKCTFILLVFPTSSLTNELSRLVDIIFLLKKNVKTARIIIYTVTDYASQLLEVKEGIDKNEIMKKIISRITINSKYDINMAISSLSNKYITNLSNKTKSHILKVYLFNSSKIKNDTQRCLASLQELIKSPYTDIIDVSFEINPTNSIIENDISIINECILYSSRIKEIIDEFYNEEIVLLVTKIETFIKLLRKVHFSWKKVMSQLDHNEIKEIQLQKLDDIAFYEYISDDYIKNMKDKLFPSESLEEILKQSKQYISQIDLIQSNNIIISSLISKFKMVISFIQTVNELLSYILSNINDDIAQFQSKSQQYLDS